MDNKTCQGCSLWYELVYNNVAQFPNGPTRPCSQGVCLAALEAAWWKECAMRNTAPRHPFEVMRWALEHAERCITDDMQEGCSRWTTE